ncbi:MAG TPA: ABC transporter ATP-binding protein [Phycisphaerae bacterium]|nr:ABC transporter ATP-binding protein [Phycisphaerae bacterium]
MNEIAIEACRLTKTFGSRVVAVNALDLAVPRGQVYGLIGRNGAGKTTLLRLLMGLLRPHGGTARLLGEDFWKAGRRHRARVAYVSQVQQLHAWMTLEELCYYAGCFYETWDAPRARRLADRFGLDWRRQVGLMSGGEQRKAAMLLAFAARAELLLLDEPAAGLDPIARRELIDEIVDVLSAGDGSTILLSTHILADLERLAETIGFMDHGRIIRQEALADLQAGMRRVQVIFDATGPPPGFAVPGAVRSRTEGAVVTAIVKLEGEDQLAPLRRIPGARVSEFPLGLEDTFIELFGADSARALREDDND